LCCTIRIRFESVPQRLLRGRSVAPPYLTEMELLHIGKRVKFASYTIYGSWNEVLGTVSICSLQASVPYSIPIWSSHMCAKVTTFCDGDSTHLNCDTAVAFASLIWFYYFDLCNHNELASKGRLYSVYWYIARNKVDIAIALRPRATIYKSDLYKTQSI